jgi:hypothetical protein
MTRLRKNKDSNKWRASHVKRDALERIAARKRLGAEGWCFLVITVVGVSFFIAVLIDVIIKVL